jgi:hypothetical protein
MGCLRIGVFVLGLAVLPSSFGGGPRRNSPVRRRQYDHGNGRNCRSLRRASVRPHRRSYASSSTLAKQIVNGAPADIFISANEEWMDHVGREKAIEAATRRDLLTNRLVVCRRAVDSQWSLSIERDSRWFQRSAAGVLPWAITTTSGWHIRPSGHDPPGGLGRRVRAGGGGRRRAGASSWSSAARPRPAIVYATDAAVTPKVRVVAVFPESSHPAVRYRWRSSPAGNGRSEEVFRFHGFRAHPRRLRAPRLRLGGGGGPR